jgi:hypothetical protein
MLCLHDFPQSHSISIPIPQDSQSHSLISILNIDIVNTVILYILYIIYYIIIIYKKIYNIIIYNNNIIILLYYIILYYIERG